MSSEKVEYDKPDAGQLLESATTLWEVSSIIEITSPAMYDIAADQLREIKGVIKLHTERRMGITRKFDDLKKDVMSLFTPALTKLDAAKEMLESRMVSYNRKIDEDRKAEERRLQAIADAEKKRLTEEADRVTKLAESEAKELRKSGDEATAAAISHAATQEAESLRLASTVITPALASTVAPKAAGTSTRSTWKGRCDDKMKLVQFVASHPEHLGLLDVNDTALHALARSQHENMSVDGCVAYQEIGISSRQA